MLLQTGNSSRLSKFSVTGTTESPDGPATANPGQPPCPSLTTAPVISKLQVAGPLLAGQLTAGQKDCTPHVETTLPSPATPVGCPRRSAFVEVKPGSLSVPLACQGPVQSAANTPQVSSNRALGATNACSRVPATTTGGQKFVTSFTAQTAGSTNSCQPLKKPKSAVLKKPNLAITSFQIIQNGIPHVTCENASVRPLLNEKNQSEPWTNFLVTSEKNSVNGTDLRKQKSDAQTEAESGPQKSETCVDNHKGNKRTSPVRLLFRRNSWTGGIKESFVNSVPQQHNSWSENKAKTKPEQHFSVTHHYNIKVSQPCVQQPKTLDSLVFRT